MLWNSHEVGKELAEDVQRQKCMRGQRMVSKSDDAEQYRENDDTAHLNRFAANCINERNRNPIAGYVARDCEDQIADSSAVQVIVDVLGAGIANCAKDSRVVQA